MAYQIKETPDFFEVHVLGESSRWEVLQIVGHLHKRDPRKERSDLWFFSEEASIPFAAFNEIAQMIGKLCRGDFVGARSAIVAAHELQWQEARMYQLESEFLPFELGVFKSRDEAVTWLKS
jgi:hypothetical protein